MQALLNARGILRQKSIYYTRNTREPKGYGAVNDDSGGGGSAGGGGGGDSGCGDSAVKPTE